MRGEQRFAVAVLAALGIVALGVALWSLQQGGIGWDARFDTEAAADVRAVDPSWSLERAYRYVPITSEFYGVLPHQLAEGLSRATAGPTELAADDPTTYTYQGLVTFLLASTSVTTLAIAIGLAFGSWLAAAFSWSLTLATPLWLGLSHVDTKDVPVAAGLTLISAGMMLGLVARTPVARGALSIAAVSAGCIVALATRPGALGLVFGLIAGTGAVTVGGNVVARRNGGQGTHPAWPLLVAGAVGLTSGLGVTWATNPIARIDMPTWVADALEVASRYPVIITVRMLGSDIETTSMPWWYVPAWLGAQLPLLTLAALALGIVGLVVAGLRHRSGDASVIALGAPVVFQGAVLPFLIAGSGAVLYDGLRHLLFMLPALLALPALGLAAIERSVGRRARAVLAAAAVGCVAASLGASIGWAPYAYAHLNPVAGRDPERRAWELDYWGVSAREGITRLRRLGLDEIVVRPSNDVGRPWGARTKRSRDSPWGLYVFRRFDARVPTGCRVLFRIERAGQVLGEGARCPPRLGSGNPTNRP